MVNSLVENYMEPTTVSQLAQEISRLISGIFIHLDEGDRQLMKRFDLTTTQYWALVHLEDPEGHSLSELAALLICDKSNMTSLVDKLEAMGLAERKRGKAGDRRYTRVVLTERGQNLRWHIKTAREEIVETRLHPLGLATMQDLYQILQRFATLLGAQFESGEVPALIEQAIERYQLTS